MHNQHESTLTFFVDEIPTIISNGDQRKVSATGHINHAFESEDITTSTKDDNNLRARKRTSESKINYLKSHLFN